MKRCNDPDCLACTTGLRVKYIPEEYMRSMERCLCGAEVAEEGRMCDDCWDDLLERAW